MRTESDKFGLLVIGNEILDGRRDDAHMRSLRAKLNARALDLAYTLYLPDDMETLVFHLRWAFAQPEPFFSCGGIGGTPDDITRQAAAKALDLPLEFHPEGMRIITAQFGARLNDARRRLVEFPQGAALIPNPVNRVPGFTIHNGHFVPGFPEMAHPMMEHVLDTGKCCGKKKIRQTILLPGAREGDIEELMETFVEIFPDVSFSSLPHLLAGGGREVVLGLYGTPERVEAADAYWKAILSSRNIPFQIQ